LNKHRIIQFVLVLLIVIVLGRRTHMLFHLPRLFTMITVIDYDYDYDYEHEHDF